MQDFAGQRVLVIGLGVSGYAAARRLAQLDAKVRVTESGSSRELQDRAASLRADGVEVELGGHDLESVDVDLAVVSPGIPPRTGIVSSLAAAGIEVMGEVELAFRLASRDFLAVTGTNGKTTTTGLLAAMLEEDGVASVAAGNIGLPLIDAVFSVPDGGAIAVEVSSFQLQATSTFRPRVAVILNIAQDHIDWHGSIEDYAAAKALITAHQHPDDTLVFNARDERVADIALGSRATKLSFTTASPEPGQVGVRDGHIVVAEEALVAVDSIPLPGAAGLEDVMAAAGAALSYGVSANAVVRAIKGYRPLSHRLETVAEVGGVTFIDDSKATNPHATLMAVRGLDDVVLIAGGRSKGIDLSVLTDVVPPVRSVIALGEATVELVRIFNGIAEVFGVSTMEEAVQAARARAAPGGSVLLSPACASLDMYESYAQRGEHFARCVRASVQRTENDGNS